MSNTPLKADLGCSRCKRASLKRKIVKISPETQWKEEGSGNEILRFTCSQCGHVAELKIQKLDAETSKRLREIFQLSPNCPAVG